MSEFPDVAVVGFEQSPTVRATEGTTNGVEMLIPVFRRLLDGAGIAKGDVGFWCSGSSDYLAGRAFSFVSAVDAIGAFPPINESHVEADAAWALYEAWIKLRTGEIDTALVYGFGKSSAGNLRRVLTLQTDPYLVAPLWPDSVSLAALQARAGLDAGAWTEKEMAQVAVRSREHAATADDAQLRDALDVDDLLAAPFLADPLRTHDCAPVGDGASAILLAAGDRARDLTGRPAWIRGIAHRIESAHLGVRDLTVSPSTVAAAASAAELAGERDWAAGADVAELHAPFTHQEILLANVLGLPAGTTVNPSGGALTGNPMFAAGLNRIGQAARRIHDGTATRALAHATQGPVLQHNLVALLEA